jgi:hypothetical protein
MTMNPRLEVDGMPKSVLITRHMELETVMVSLRGINR